MGGPRLPRHPVRRRGVQRQAGNLTWPSCGPSTSCSPNFKPGWHSLASQTWAYSPILSLQKMTFGSISRPKCLGELSRGKAGYCQVSFSLGSSKHPGRKAQESGSRTAGQQISTGIWPNQNTSKWFALTMMFTTSCAPNQFQPKLHTGHTKYVRYVLMLFCRRHFPLKRLESKTVSCFLRHIVCIAAVPQVRPCGQSVVQAVPSAHVVGTPCGYTRLALSSLHSFACIAQ